MMDKQTSDHAQKGPGVAGSPRNTKDTSASALKGLSSGRMPSGQPNPTGSRGSERKR